MTHRVFSGKLGLGSKATLGALTRAGGEWRGNLGGAEGPARMEGHMARYQNKTEVREKFQQIFERQPYSVEIDDIDLEMSKGVFPADAATSTAMIMQALREFEPTVALDMGCGCGVLSIHLRRLGAELVYAADLNSAAVECARKNAARNGYNDIRVLQSDLFSSIPPAVQFDLIVFNQFYFPSDIDWFGPTRDGGTNIITRFFAEAPERMTPGGVIVMSFADVAGPEHDPARLARERGFEVEELTYVRDEHGHEKLVLIFPNPMSQ